MAPTLVASRTALPPEGAAPPVARLSRFHVPCWRGGDADSLFASRTAALAHTSAAAPVGSTAPAGLERDATTLVASRTALRSEAGTSAVCEIADASAIVVARLTNL